MMMIDTYDQAKENPQRRRSSQWDALDFHLVEEDLVDVPSHSAVPKRNSLKYPTQKESLEHHFVPKRRKLVATMHVIVALLDLLNTVREKRAKEEEEAEKKKHRPPTRRRAAPKHANPKHKKRLVRGKKKHAGAHDLETDLSKLHLGGSTKHTHFSTIEVREYEKILDVNPGSRRGPALGIGWKYHHSVPISVDTYEENRPPRRMIGKDYRPLTEAKRMQILKEQGYSKLELDVAIKETNEARQSRRKTLELLEKHHGVDRCEEKREAAALKLQRLTRMRRSSQAELEELWKKANSPSRPSPGKGHRKHFSLKSLVSN